MDYTLKKFRDELIEYINEVIYIAAVLDNPATPEVNEATPAVCYVASVYKNEFAPANDWTPKFPAVFVRIDSVNSEVYSADSRALKQIVDFTVYVADRDDALTHVTRLFDALNGCNIDDLNEKLKMTGIEFIDYQPGLEVFALKGTVGVSLDIT